jgi:hypothetical protein
MYLDNYNSAKKLTATTTGTYIDDFGMGQATTLGTYTVIYTVKTNQEILQCIITILKLLTQKLLL